MHVNAITPLALASGCIHVARPDAIFPGGTGVRRGRPYSGLTFVRPLPAGAVAPEGFLNELQVFLTAPVEGGRTAESRNQGQFEHRVRGRRHHRRLASQREAHHP